MATVTEKVCDVGGCFTRNAKGFEVFSDRRMDAAGSMEDWHHCFDLCDAHSLALARKILYSIQPEEAKKIIDEFGINSREG